MKLLIATIVLVAVSGCSSAPVKVLMKNCEDLGSNLYSCEELPKNTPRERR